MVQRMGFEESEAQEAVRQNELPLDYDDLPLVRAATGPADLPEQPEVLRSFAVPRLCVWLQGELELAEPEIFLDAAGWSLLDCSAELPDFRSISTAPHAADHQLDCVKAGEPLFT